MEKKRVRWSLIGVSLTSLFLSGIAFAETEAEEVQLQTTEKSIDQEAKAGSESTRAEALAKQFGVPVSTVQDLQNKGRGWGEVSIELAMANQLAKTDSKTYPTLADAIQKIESLRAEGKGWGHISKEFGFKLGPVVSQAAHTRAELRSLDKTAQMKMEEKGKIEEGGAHMEREGRPDHFDRGERPDRPERPAGLEHSNHGGRS